MSEGSLPPFGNLRSGFPPFSLAKRVAGGIRNRFRRTPRKPRPGETVGPDPELRSRAAGAIRAYAEAHSALFERAERLRARAERLEGEGTPSDSARNRAERAEREVESGLSELRASFAASEGGREGHIAFDREVQLHYPALKVPDGSAL